MATISLTIGKAPVFAPVRGWFAFQEGYSGDRNKRRAVFAWLSELVKCPYCLAHWVSFVLVAIYQPSFLGTEVWDYFFEALAIACVSTFWGAIIFRAYTVVK